MSHATLLGKPPRHRALPVDRARTVDGQVRAGTVRIVRQPGPPAAETVPRTPSRAPVRRSVAAAAGLAGLTLATWMLLRGDLTDALPEPPAPGQVPSIPSPGPPPQPTPTP